MSKETNPDEFYAKLKDQLIQTSLWPNVYLYKFIVPAQPDQSKTLLAIFDNQGAVITSKKSKSGKYESYSIKLKLKNPDAVIAKYKEVAEKIVGVISL
ncbi:DUF493 family protein [Aquimarina agarilytica]|uniref:DUF493 family protein n=1 Tax=Aquimarina agarilytica TaxID=1087449 RepID=UPI000287F367|nr:DUF493 family protein [Aquimarina agarilytica]